MPIFRVRLRTLLALLVAAACAWSVPATAADAAPAFDFKKELQGLRTSIDEVRGILSQADGSAALDEKRRAVERFDALKTRVQDFTTRAIAAGRTEDEVTEYLERFRFAGLAKIDRDLRAAINEAGAAAKPKE